MEEGVRDYSLVIFPLFFDLFEIVSRSSGGGCKGAIAPYSMFIAVI